MDATVPAGTPLFHECAFRKICGLVDTLGGGTDFIGWGARPHPSLTLRFLPFSLARKMKQDAVWRDCPRGLKTNHFDPYVCEDALEAAVHRGSACDRRRGCHSSANHAAPLPSDAFVDDAAGNSIATNFAGTPLLLHLRLTYFFFFLLVVFLSISNIDRHPQLWDTARQNFVFPLRRRATAFSCVSVR